LDFGEGFFIIKIMVTEITLLPEYECRIFINANGGITIMQPSQSHDDMIILASRARVNQLIRALQALKKTATFETSEEDA
jgi:hypothetical protein